MIIKTLLCNHFVHNFVFSLTRHHHRTRADIYKNITPDYYGYRDDDDGLLTPLESQREVIIVENVLR